MNKITIIINNQKESLEVELNKTLYDALSDKNKALPHGCLSGSCGTCKCFVKEGNKLLSPPSAIEEDTINHIQNGLEDKSRIIRLACRAKIIHQGEIIIEPFRI